LNIKRIISTFWKEKILLLRDPGGLAMLLIMPVLLIVTMAIVQDAPFKDYQDVSFKILWADADHRLLSDSLKSMFNKSPQFELIDSIEGRPLSKLQVYQLVKRGNYSIGIVITKGSYAEILNRTNKILNLIGSAGGQPSIIPVRQEIDSLNVVLLFDPVAKSTFKMAVQNAVEKMLFKVQMDILFSKLGRTPDGVSAVDSHSGNIQSLLGEKLIVKNLGKVKSSSLVMNSVQHNVPAWIVFAIFFLIIPLSGNYIKEKGEGTRWMIGMTRGSHMDILFGKVLFYTCFGLFQFIFILIISNLILPYVGLPTLEIGWSVFPAMAATLGIAFAAVSLGIMIGTLFNTYHQAMMFGSIAIVILSAIGGIWVPIEVLPPTLQYLAGISPLQWGLHLFQDIFLRGIEWKTYFLEIGLLLIFGMICLLIAFYFHRLQTKKAG